MSSEAEPERKRSGRIYLLELYQGMMNDTDGEGGISVTLNVQGCVVSGFIIGMKPYYEGISKLTIESAVGKPGEHITETKQDLQEIFQDIIKSAKIASDEGKPINHIFLRDAKIYTGERIMSSKGGYWAGRIDDVNGFMLGAL